MSKNIFLRIELFNWSFIGGYSIVDTRLALQLHQTNILSDLICRIHYLIVVMYLGVERVEKFAA